MTFSLNLKKRLLFLLFAFVICYFVTSVIAGLVTYKFGADSTPAMRIVTVIQDVVLFILPAVATAVFVTRRPAELMCIDRKPKFSPLFVALCALVVSIPAMNILIWLNEQVVLPESIETVLKEMEQRASGAVVVLQGAHTVPNLIMTIMIVAVFAGLSEEILFRGAFQRLMSTGGINPHAAIWIAATVFSLLHLQFYGFFPRVLLGAFFGYLLYWTGSLWVPIIMHILNNTIYLLGSWFSAEGEKSAVDTVGLDDGYVLAAVSLVLTVVAIWYLRKVCLCSSKVGSGKEAN